MLIGASGAGERDDHAEGAPGERADTQRRREHPAAEAGAETDTARGDLGDDQDQHQLEPEAGIERPVGGLVTDADNLGIGGGDGADRDAAERRLGPFGDGHAAGEARAPHRAGHEQHGDTGADHAEQQKHRHFEIGGDFHRRNDEGGVIAEMRARDHRADHRRDDHRREGGEAVMSDHHLEGEKHPGDRRVERRGDAAGDTAAEQGQHLRPAEADPLAEPARHGRREVHYRPFAADRGAGADRRRRGERLGDAVAQAHPPAAHRARLDHVGDGLRPTAAQNEVDEQADHQAADHRHDQALPPRQGRGEGDHMVGSGAVGGALDRVDGGAKQDRPVAGGKADHRGERGHHQMVVTAQAPPQAFARPVSGCHRGGGSVVFEGGGRGNRHPA